MVRRRRGRRAARRRDRASSGSPASLVSPAYLAGADGSLGRAERRASASYYAALYAFWAVLLAVPLAGNLGVAWLLVEATTAASALLVGFSGRPRALEAGWKYLVLTTLGLAVALLGIVVLSAGVAGGGIERLSLARARARYALRHARAPRRLRPPPRRPGGEDRLGAGAQLAPRRAQRGAASGLGAAVGCAAARRPARRLALRARARARRSAPTAARTS